MSKIGHTRHMESYEMVSTALALKSSHMYHIKTLHHHHHCGLNQDVVCMSIWSSPRVLFKYILYTQRTSFIDVHNAIIATTPHLFSIVIMLTNYMQKQRVVRKKELSKNRFHRLTKHNLTLIISNYNNVIITYVINNLCTYLNFPLILTRNRNKNYLC